MCPPSSFPPESPHSSNNPPKEHPPNTIPPSPLCKSAYNLVQQSFPPAIFNHSFRTYLYAQTLAQHTSSPWAAPDRLPLLFTACLFHDMGCAVQNDGPQRFEVCGGDAAAEHLRQYDVCEADIQEVWTAIALHTSSGIAERISPLARIVRLAVLMDFKVLGQNPWVTADELKIDDEGYRRSVEEKYPRLEPEKVLGDIVAEQGLRQSTKAPGASWTGDLVRAAKEEPEWDGVNKGF